jgi:periplasmic protein TonB
LFVRVDTISGLSALALHALVALILLRVPPPRPRPPSTVDVEIRRPPPPTKVETPPAPPPPEPPRKVEPKVVKTAPPPAAPPPNREPPKEPPKEVKPVFGVSMESTTEGDSSFQVPTGNTTMIDPTKSGKGTPQPLPAAPPGPPKNEYKPVADVYIKQLPEIDGEACARTVSYPQEAEQLGIEGEVKLRVSLDEAGKVHEIKLLKGLGHGLDQAAMNALRYKCRFKPAIGTDGKPAPYIIQTYTWTFELPR